MSNAFSKLLTSLASFSARFNPFSEKQIKGIRKEIPWQSLQVEEVVKIPYPEPLYLLNENRSDVRCNSTSAITDAIRKWKNNSISCPISYSGHNSYFLFGHCQTSAIKNREIEEELSQQYNELFPIAYSKAEWNYICVANQAKAQTGVEKKLQMLLAAIKPETLETSLRQFNRNGLKVDFYQPRLFSLLDYLVNFKTSEQVTEKVESYAVLEMGAQSSTLTIYSQNGFYQEEIPIGGYHFSLQLCGLILFGCKENDDQSTADCKILDAVDEKSIDGYSAKLFTEAEELKLNALKTIDQKVDPKLVFQKMRSSFQNLLSLVQQSIDKWRSGNKLHEPPRTLAKLTLVGSATELPGLLQFLEKNLNGIEVSNIETPDSIQFAKNVDKNLLLRDVGDMLYPLMSAINGLAYGYQCNFMKKSLRTPKEVWGVHIGTHCLRAVRVSKK